MSAQDFVPVQRECFWFIDAAAGGQLLFPNHFSGQLLDVDAAVHFVARHVIPACFILIVGLDRHRCGITGEEPRGDPNARHIYREQTEAAGPGKMLVRGEVFEDEPRRDLFEDEIAGLGAFEPEWLKRRQTVLDRDTIFWTERELAS